MKRKERRWLWSIAALAILAGSGYWFVFDSLRSADKDSEFAGEPLIVPITYGDIEEIVATTGTLTLASSPPDSGGAETGPSGLIVATEIIETEAEKLAAITDLYITTTRGRDRRWHGNLSDVRLAPTVNGGFTGFHVEFGVDNADGELEPGQSVQVFFVATLAEDVPVVPLGALTFADPGGDAAEATVRVSADNSFETRSVSLGVRNRVAAEVVSGLKPGERVVAGTILPAVEYDPDSRREPRDFRDRLFEPAPGRR